MQERRSSVWLCTTIAIATFLIAIGGGSSGSPIMERFLADACEHYDLEPSSKSCKNNTEAQNMANEKLFWFNLATYGPQLTTVSASSHLGDVFGRKFAIGLPLVGALTTALVAGNVPLSLFFPVIIPCVTIVNFTGGYFCGIGAIFASVADATVGFPTSRRQVLFAAVEGVFWLGLILGPSMVGVLADQFGASRSLLFPASCDFGCLVIVLMFFKTKETKDRTPFSLAKCNPITTMWSFVRRNRVAPVIGMAVLLNMMCVMCVTATMAVWLRNHMNFSYTEIGLLQTVLCASNAVGLLVLMPLSQRINLGPKGTLLVAASSLILWPLLWSFGVNPWGAACFSCVASLFFPVARTVVAGFYPPTDYGLALGVVAALEATATFFGSVAGPPLYEAVGWQATFFICSCLPVLGWLLTLTLPKKLYANVVSEPKTLDGEATLLHDPTHALKNDYDSTA